MQKKSPQGDFFWCKILQPTIQIPNYIPDSLSKVETHLAGAQRIFTESSLTSLRLFPFYPSHRTVVTKQVAATSCYAVNFFSTTFRFAYRESPGRAPPSLNTIRTYLQVKLILLKHYHLFYEPIQRFVQIRTPPDAQLQFPKPFALFIRAFNFYPFPNTNQLALDQVPYTPAQISLLHSLLNGVEKNRAQFSNIILCAASGIVCSAPTYAANEGGCGWARGSGNQL